MEIELYSKMQDPIEAIEKIGLFFAQSGMFGCEKAQQGMVLAMACLAERKSPLEIKRTYHLLNGELSMRADAMLAQFRQKGGKHKIVARTADRAAVELERDGEKQLFSFTWEEAQQEPFVWSWKDPLTQKVLAKPVPKKNWATPRARTQMLWSRVISDGVRAMDPGIVAGSYTPEEIDDDSSAPSAGSGKAVFTAPAPTHAPESKQPSAGPVIDLSPLADPVLTTAPAGQSPASEEGKPVVAQVNPETGKITIETCRAIEEAIGDENGAAAMAWLKAQTPPWIGEKGLLDLTVKRAQKILNNPQGFRDTIKAGAK